MIVPFSKARPGEESFTFTDPTGEYAWVTDPEWFDDIDEPVTVTRQQWQLICEDRVTFHPKTELCPTCGGEGTVACPTCDGAETHPLAGKIEVLS